MFKKGSKTFIVVFIFLVLGFFIKDLTSLDTSVIKVILSITCMLITSFLPIILFTKTEIYLIFFKALIYAYLSAFYLVGLSVFLELAFILFVLSIVVFLFMESLYFLKYKMIKNFENNL